ncbi:penicillin acylase family protein [bacterium]|nr:penicillin acylase family protein [bacterium]
MRETPATRARNILQACVQLAATAVLAACAATAPAPASSPETATAAAATLVPGLRQPVEILVDAVGVAHIYALDEHDLFFAQGYNVARDRLFQLEWWRRRSTGTFAEIAGPDALDIDIASRLFRPDHTAASELDHYHPNGSTIIPAFVAGVNAYIDAANRDPDSLPLEFRLLGIRPQHWTIDDVVSRHNGLYRNATSEIDAAIAVAAFGTEKVQLMEPFQPEGVPIDPPPGVDLAAITRDTLGRYLDRLKPSPATPEMIVDPEARATRSMAEVPSADAHDEGSNAWVVSGARTASGAPILANDPHRQIAVPSLRYWVHLNAPGWNVIGAGEPALPGVSIGHNDAGAWGLTIFSADQEDIYVYETDPERPGMYRFGGSWEPLRTRREQIPVRGQPPAEVELRYTHHGPVISEDPANRRLYALRAGWREPGTAPYLASLRLNQAASWDEFRAAAAYHLMPSENLVWADKSGAIGWQSVGIVPVRDGWTGLLPVPADGRHEWSGFVAGADMPHVVNPPSGYFATANEFNVPAGDTRLFGLKWAEPFRKQRLDEVLSQMQGATPADMARLQGDNASMPARKLVGRLAPIAMTDPALADVQARLVAWDKVLSTDSAEALIYTGWLRAIERRITAELARGGPADALPDVSVRKILDWADRPQLILAGDARARMDALLRNALAEALDEIRRVHGPDMATWRYGGPKAHHVRMQHPLSPAVSPALRERLEVGPIDRGGDVNTVNNTGNNFNQPSGASIRMVMDLADWNRSLGVNSPGQSGDPDSPHYRDLADIWAAADTHPLPFTRDAVEARTKTRIRLEPGR